MTDAAIAGLAPRTGTRAACQAVGAAQAGWYRRHRQSPPPPRPEPIAHRDRRQPRALDPAERQSILRVLHSGRFADAAPAEVWATLLDEGTYLGSVSTFYRVLRAQGEVRERRRQATHPAKVKPELMAAEPNAVWSWDITKLHGPAKWTYYYLYVILDIFSRHVTGWMVATRESAALAERLIADSCAKQRIGHGQLAIHADRGSSMTSKPVAFLLADLGVTQSHSRPHVSNDNPFSESQFKTMKYRPAFPGQFGSIQDARAHCQAFFSWYNNDHRHSGLGLHTPADVHYGRAGAVRAARASVLAAACATHPERFVLRPPAPPKLPAASWINRPQPQPAPAPGGTLLTGEPACPA
jgi:putative transposase